jgi:hypothetical protein
MFGYKVDFSLINSFTDLFEIRLNPNVSLWNNVSSLQIALAIILLIIAIGTICIGGLCLWAILGTTLQRFFFLSIFGVFNYFWVFLILSFCLFLKFAVIDNHSHHPLYLDVLANDTSIIA